MCMYQTCPPTPERATWVLKPFLWGKEMEISDKEILEIAGKKFISSLNYNAETGFFTWLPKSSECKDYKRWNVRYAGCIAGGIDSSNGYVNIVLKVGSRVRKFKAHRIAYLLNNGKWPTGEVDHINHDRADNRWINLREVSRSENQQNAKPQINNVSGSTGVCWHKQIGKWYAQSSHKGVKHYLGVFTDKNDAIEAVRKFYDEKGFHKNHGTHAAVRAAAVTADQAQERLERIAVIVEAKERMA